MAEPIKTKVKSVSIPWLILSYILTATSLLNLIQDLSPISLYGKLKIWVDAYGLFIERVGEFLFGWMKVYWFGISAAEHHILAIAGLLGISAYRATYKMHRDWGYDSTDSRLESTPQLLLYFSLAFVPALLLPDYWGSAFAGISIIVQTIRVVTHIHSPSGPISSRAPGREVLIELLGVIALLVLILVINHAAFRPSDA